MNNAMMYQKQQTKRKTVIHGESVFTAGFPRMMKLNGESASISNQRDILTNYCNSQGWQIVGVFQDDGYTGLNTERPELQRLLQACEKRSGQSGKSRKTRAVWERNHDRQGI